ncbi:uncharacterized protein [Venturia canescens]|uniref:uncharacterized protein n=1 Tax=Venturia canescens TaxID=32260 RepID=UPI001C9BE4D3|nr:uncharacterized protein LOC122416103 [Venturia canescens]
MSDEHDPQELLNDDEENSSHRGRRRRGTQEPGTWSQDLFYTLPKQPSYISRQSLARLMSKIGTGSSTLTESIGRGTTGHGESFRGRGFIRSQVISRSDSLQLDRRPL